MAQTNGLSIQLLDTFWPIITDFVCVLHPFRSKPTYFTQNLKKLFLFTIILTFSLNGVKCDSNKLFTNDFAVSLKQHKCDENSAQSLADRHGFQYVGQVFNSIDHKYDK